MKLVSPFLLFTRSGQYRNQDNNEVNMHSFFILLCLTFSLNAAAHICEGRWEQIAGEPDVCFDPTLDLKEVRFRDGTVGIFDQNTTPMAHVYEMNSVSSLLGIAQPLMGRYAITINSDNGERVVNRLNRHGGVERFWGEFSYAVTRVRCDENTLSDKIKEPLNSFMMLFLSEKQTCTYRRVR